ncbi:MAG: SDR family NAD(P)-dependent oxidoreductase [Candidatus Binatia bacterium]
MSETTRSPLDELFGLDGRVAVVTGASSGLGVEFADALVSAGATVVVLARRKSKLEEQAELLGRRHGRRVHSVAVDLTDREAAEKVFKDLETAHGSIDILVNNAGMAPTGSAEKQWPEQWESTLELNLTAAFHLALLAAKSMKRGGRGGRVINVASIFGQLGSSLFRLSAYAAAKGGLCNLTRQLAVEWAPHGITVNAIAPAWFPTEMTEESLTKAGIVESMGKACPMGRIGRSGELRTACLFLASPASSYVTGAIIPVDGGYGAW